MNKAHEWDDTSSVQTKDGKNGSQGYCRLELQF